MMAPKTTATVVPLGRATQSGWRLIRPVLGGILAVWFVVNTYSLLTVPSSVKPAAVVAFLPMIPFAVAVTLVWLMADDRPYLEFTDVSVVERHRLFSAEIRWGEVTALRMVRECDGRPVGSLGAALVLETKSTTPFPVAPGSSIVLLPGELGSPEALGQVLVELMRHCPTGSVDADVALLFGLTQRVAARDNWAGSVPATAVSPLDPAIRTYRGSAAPAARLVDAAFEYFHGDIDCAMEKSAEALLMEPGVWDALLCQAVCERALGQGGEYEAKLKEVLEACPPPEVTRALAREGG